MRRVDENGCALLPEDEKGEMLRRHIPYRLSLLRDGHRPSWVAACQHTNQAFEAGANAGRILLSFLGLECDRDGALKPAHDHHKNKDNETDDVKAPDVGGQFVRIDELPESEREILAKFIRGVSKACAHLTDGSEHELDLEVYDEAAPIIFCLMAGRFPDHAGKWPKWIRSSA